MILAWRNHFLSILILRPKVKEILEMWLKNFCEYGSSNIHHVKTSIFHCREWVVGQCSSIQLNECLNQSKTGNQEEKNGKYNIILYSLYWNNQV